MMTNDSLSNMSYKITKFIDSVLFLQENVPKGIVVMNPVTYFFIRRFHKILGIETRSMIGAQAIIEPPSMYYWSDDRLIWASPLVPTRAIYIAKEKHGIPVIEACLDPKRTFFMENL